MPWSSPHFSNPKQANNNGDDIPQSKRNKLPPCPFLEVSLGYLESKVKDDDTNKDKDNDNDKDKDNDNLEGLLEDFQFGNGRDSDEEGSLADIFNNATTHKNKEDNKIDTNLKIDTKIHT
eukprot:jgi/Psemu1/25642/gm1.25642_g